MVLLDSLAELEESVGLTAGYAELRGEVAYDLGPATAANRYEQAPHGGSRVEPGTVSVKGD
jgi:hypothetical protein